MMRNAILSAAIIIAILSIAISVIWMENEGTVIFISVLIFASYGIYDANIKKGESNE